jgi:hypothetical protein
MIYRGGSDLVVHPFLSRKDYMNREERELEGSWLVFLVQDCDPVVWVCYTECEVGFSAILPQEAKADGVPK